MMLEKMVKLLKNFHKQVHDKIERQNKNYQI